MGPAIALPLSIRDGLPWSFHCVLDGAPKHDAFVTEILQRLGVGERAHRGLREAIVARLPRDLDELDMGDFLTILEELIPIRWNDDTTRVPPELEVELVAVCARVLENVVRPAMPKPVASDLLREMRRLASDAIDPSLHDELVASVSDLLAHDLWRCQGEERRLAESVVSHVARRARLRFAP